MYANADGTGRDTHCFVIQWDEHKRNLAHHKREDLIPIKHGLRNAPKTIIPGAPQGEERIPIYLADGTGRDGYILGNNAGLIEKYKPYRLMNDLR